MPPPRYPANRNQLKLNLDFDTIDRLRTRAKERGTADLTRCAYELLQEALGLRTAPDPTPAPDSGSHLTFDWQRVCAPPGRNGG